MRASSEAPPRTDPRAGGTVSGALHRAIGRGVLLATATLWVPVSPAHAQRAPAGMTVADIAVPGAGAVRLANAAERAALDQSAPWSEFTSRHGPWSAYWNVGTGTPHRAFGEGIPLPGYADRADAVEAAVRAFIAAEARLFRAPTLETTRVQRVRNTWYVSFRQTVRGMPVLFSDWEFRVGANGRLFALGADAHRRVPATVGAGPRLPAVVAREAARAGLRFDPVRDRLAGGETVALLPVTAEDGLSYRAVTEVRVTTEDPPGDWRTLVDAGDGEVLWRQNRIRYAIAGTVTGTTHLSLPTDPLAPRPLPHLTVNVGPTPTVTDAAGGYSASAVGSVMVTAQLKGSFCDVNRQDGVPDAAFTTAATDPATVDIAWTSGNSHDAERDGYHHLNVVHDYVRALDPGATNLDYVAPCNVNINNTCNAYYSPSDGSVNFYLAGGGCPNTATMPDVVYHEYGHGVNDHIYYLAGQPGGMTNGALHEGMADVLATFLQDDPNAGKGFFGPGTILRTLDNTRRWPEDASADPHLAGLIIGGAFWDLRRTAGLAVASQLSHFAKYGVPDDLDDGVAMNEFFVETLVADDDDASLSNGTPHFAQMLEAFNAHGIGTLMFMNIGHTPLADQTGPGAYLVTATTSYSGPFGGLSGPPQLHYQVNGGTYQTVSMTPSQGQYSASIPHQIGAVVSYYLSVSDTYGQTLTAPGAAPASVYSFLSGSPNTLLDHDQETNQGWVAGTAGDNATTGIWIRSDPNGTWVHFPLEVQPEDDHTPSPGFLCWVTGNAIPGQPVGTNDVDDGHTTLTTPLFDGTASGLANPVIRYWRWYTNNQGSSPGEDLWRVDISNDAGIHWVSVESTTQSSNAWQRVLFPISNYVAPSEFMRMRFIAEDTGSPSLVEAAVDDFQLLAFTPGPVAVDGPEVPRGLTLAVASANPGTGPMRLSYSLPAWGVVSLRIYDLAGRAVRTLASGRQDAGRHTLDWDGRDDGGTGLPSGTYFARLTAAGAAASRTLVRTR
jgi:hypothetical protein